MVLFKTDRIKVTYTPLYDEVHHTEIPVYYVEDSENFFTLDTCPDLNEETLIQMMADYRLIRMEQIQNN